MSSPDLVVLGVHRSGTSVVAAVLDLMGGILPDERYLVEPKPDNPEGFNENAVLVDLNERILAAFGGHWSAPPDLAVGWHRDAQLNDLRREAARSWVETMPAVDRIWKDPRNCLTLPFWRDIVGSHVVILVRRDPAEVIRSLVRRNAFRVPLACAIWERYTREVLRNLDPDTPVVVIDYHELLEDPQGSVHRLANDLRQTGFDAHDHDPDTLDRIVVRPPRRTDDTPAVRLSGEQRDLWTLLLERPMRDASPQLPPETPWATALIEERRGRLCFEQQLIALEADFLQERNSKPFWWRKGRGLLRHLRGATK